MVEQGRLIGLVSRADVVRAFVRPDHDIAADAREQLELQQSLLGEGGQADVTVSQGVAVLTGMTHQRRDAELLPRVIREIPGVVEVRSQLTWSVDE